MRNSNFIDIAGGIVVPLIKAPKVRVYAMKEMESQARRKNSMYASLRKTAAVDVNGLDRTERAETPGCT